MIRPVLWSFRRCPYAMRARLAILCSGVSVDLREVVLRDKPQAFLDTSPTATVPCLDHGAGVLDESYDIMIWALSINDPENWLIKPVETKELIATCDGPFKAALDRYKYASRYEDVEVAAEREKAGLFINRLNEMLTDRWLFGPQPSLADMAILPFVRQFAHVDLSWFDAQPWGNAIRWLEAFKNSDRFAAIMKKYPQWQLQAPEIPFP